jgi:serine/threonine protein kinase
MNLSARDLTGPRGKASVENSAQLGRGATATVHPARLGGYPYAAKMFLEDRPFPTAKILAMIANPPSRLTDQRGSGRTGQLAWPIAILSDDKDQDVGFLMPVVDLKVSFPLDYFYDQTLFKRLKSPNEAALSFKLEIARNLSSIVAELHKQGHYFIDMKPQNIRVTLESHDVCLLDCDGFSIFGNGRRYPAELISTDYIAPEVQRRNSSPADLTEPQDRYALAVILFQLLDRGTHPFQGIVTAPNITVNTNDEKAAAGLYPHGLISDARIKPRPQSTHHLWGEDTRTLFDRAFTSNSPNERPSAQEWTDHFKSLLDNKVLVRCDRMPDSLEHIRFRGKGCPACYLIGLPAFKPKARTESPKVEPAPTPPPQLNTQSNNKGWWISIGGIVALFLFLAAVFQADNSKPYPSTSEQAPPTPIQQSTPQKIVKAEQYVSLFVSERRAIGYSLGNQSEFEADEKALAQCEKQTRSKQDLCIKFLAGPGKCIGISRATNGALGASIADDYVDAGVLSQSSCRQNGGTDCPYPTATIFCLK